MPYFYLICERFEDGLVHPAYSMEDKSARHFKNSSKRLFVVKTEMDGIGLSNPM